MNEARPLTAVDANLSRAAQGRDRRTAGLQIFSPNFRAGLKCQEPHPELVEGCVPIRLTQTPTTYGFSGEPDRVRLSGGNRPLAVLPDQRRAGGEHQKPAVDATGRKRQDLPGPATNSERVSSTLSRRRSRDTSFTRRP